MVRGSDDFLGRVLVCHRLLWLGIPAAQKAVMGADIVRRGKDPALETIPFV